MQETIHWINDGKEFLWLSERDGWRHLYRVDSSGQASPLVTPGDFDVIELLTDRPEPRAGLLHRLARQPDPALSLPGDARWTGPPRGHAGRTSRARHDYQISPDGQWAIHRFSAFDTATDHRSRQPARSRAGADPGREQSTARQVRGARRQSRTEFFRVDIGDGVALDGWCLKPPDFDPSPEYPLLVHVYGEPAGQTVLDRWGGDNYLWHRMLAQNGYVVMSFDNRGTPAPRGRAWRKCGLPPGRHPRPEGTGRGASRRVRGTRPYIDPDRRRNLGLERRRFDDA